MFKDEQRDKVYNEIRQHDLRSFAGELTAGVFATAAEGAGVKIGKSALNLVNLTWLSISAAIHPTRNFAGVLTTTLKLLTDQETFCSTNVGTAKKQGESQKRREKQGKTKGKGKSGKQRSKHDPRRADPTE